LHQFNAFVLETKKTRRDAIVKGWTETLSFFQGYAIIFSRLQDVAKVCVVASRIRSKIFKNIKILRIGDTATEVLGSSLLCVLNLQAHIAHLTESGYIKDLGLPKQCKKRMRYEFVPMVVDGVMNCCLDGLAASIKWDLWGSSAVVDKVKSLSRLQVSWKP